MGRTLDNKTGKADPPELERAKDSPFVMAFKVPLMNGYEIKDMRERDKKELQRFLEDTVYKGLTISQVDKLYLRKQGLADAPPVKYKDMELYHYGKDNNPFRVFGYYDQNKYFIICRIDGKHNTHRG